MAYFNLSQRRKDLLKAVVLEFIKTGQPVSSNFIYKNYDFGIKSAMIRNELLELTKEKYLFQPYYSSARIPTDLGYEFFVKSILEEDNLNFKIDSLIVNLFKNKDWKNLAKKISERLNLLSFIADLTRERFIYKEGLEYLIDKINLENISQLKKIIRDFENLDEEIFEDDKILKEKNFIKIFIGRKNPWCKSDFISVVAGDYQICNSRILISVMGPKRMDYKKVYFIFKGLKNIKV